MKISISLVALTGTFVTDIRRASKALQKEMEAMRRKSEQDMRGMQVALRRFAAEAGILFTVVKAGRMLDQFNNLNSRLKVVTKTTAEYNAAQQQTLAIAQRTYTGLENTVVLYQRVQQALRGLGESQATALEVTELINKSLQVGGATTIQATAAIQQMSQALASGVLRGDEFNSIMENAPRIQEALAKSLNISVGDLRAMAEAGKLTTEVVINALKTQSKAINEEFSKLPLTMARAWTVFENSTLVALGNIDKALGVSGAIAGSVHWLAQELDLVPNAIALWGKELDVFRSRGDGFWEDFAVSADTWAWSTKDRIQEVADFFLLLPTSVTTVLVLIAAEFDKLGIRINDVLNVAVYVGLEAWERMRHGAEIMVLKVDNIFRKMLNSIIRAFVGVNNTVADLAAAAGLDSLAESLDSVSESAIGLIEGEDAIRSAMDASNAAFENRINSLDQMRAESAALTAATVETANTAINSALDEYDAAKTLLHAKKDLAKASEEKLAIDRKTILSDKDIAKQAKENERNIKKQEGAYIKLVEAAGKLSSKVAGPIAQAWDEYNRRLTDYRQWAEEAAKASAKLGSAGLSLTQIINAEKEAIQAAADARDAEIDAILESEEVRKEESDIRGKLLKSYDDEIRMLGLTAEERQAEEVLIRAVEDARRESITQKDKSIRLDKTEQEELRKLLLLREKELEFARRSAELADIYQNRWKGAVEDVSDAFVDWMVDGTKGFKDLASSIKDIAKSLVADLLRTFARRLILNIEMSAQGGGIGNLLGGAGGAGGGIGNLLSSVASMFGFRTAAGSATSGMFSGLSAMPGGAGFSGVAANSGGMFGGGMFGAGGTGMTAGGMLGAAGGAFVGLQGIRNGNPLQGAAGGAMAGMQIGGPWGALVGAIVGGLGALIHGKKEPDFRLGGSDARIRGREGGFSTVFGDVQAGSRQLSWESLVEPMQQFDAAIADLVNTMGDGQPQLDAITAALATWEVDLRGSAATAENVLGSRFNTILETFGSDIQDFVGEVGTVQERVTRLTDALAIDKIVDTGELGDTFAEVADLLTDYRDGTEAIADTYARVLGSVTLLDEALNLSGVSLALTRNELIRFATDITEAAGGLSNAQALWSSYFENFYDGQETLLAAVTAARRDAVSQFEDINLNSNDFMGEGGKEAFREMFESLLPTLSAEAVVQWLEAANALGIVVDLSEQYNDALEEQASLLPNFMSEVESALAEFDPFTSIENRLAAQRTANDVLIQQAIELGASESDLMLVRQLGQARLNALLDEQNQLIADGLAVLAARVAAEQELNAFVQQLSATAGGGIGTFTSSLQQLNEEYQNNVSRLNELAVAAGYAGASTEQLAAAAGAFRAQVAALVQELVASAQSLISQLYGRRNSSSSSGDGGDHDWQNFGSGPGTTGGIEEVNAAMEDRYKTELEYLNAIQDWLDSLDLSALSPLTPQERLVEAQSEYQRLLGLAQGGDLEALSQLQDAADALLSESQSYYGGVGPYRDIFESVREQMQALVDRGPLNAPPDDVPGTTGTPAGERVLLVEPGDGFVELSELERFTIATELVGVLSELITASNQSLSEVSEQLGLDLRELVADLGVNLTDLTVGTTTQLADVARQLGVELPDLATEVGFSLGDLGDEQSLLNDALEEVINSTPPAIRDQLQAYLTAIEQATIDGNPLPAIAEMEAAINTLSPDIRAALAPFFEGVSSPVSSLLLTTIGQAEDIANIVGLVGDILASLGSDDDGGGGLGFVGFGNPNMGPFPPSPKVGEGGGFDSVTSNVVQMDKYIASMKASEDRAAKLAAANNELVDRNNQLLASIKQNTTPSPAKRSY